MRIEGIAVLNYPKVPPNGPDPQRLPQFCLLLDIFMIKANSEGS